MKAFFLESIRFRPRVSRFLCWLKSSAGGANVSTLSVGQAPGQSGLLVAYGAGNPNVAAAVAEHVACGWPAICWDVGYWGQSYRFALNGHHPTTLPEVSGDRFDSQGLALRDDYDPDGHIVVVGLGPKSRYMDVTWEELALARIRAQYPGRRVVYRPKPRREFVPLNVETDNESSIASVLRGASLVVCRHSNVGVDAAFAGIPAVVESGTASLLYGSDLANPVRPSAQQRLGFLRALAWLNWQDEEAHDVRIWHWIRHCIGVPPLSDRYL